MSEPWVRIEADCASALALPEAAEWVESVLVAGRTLHQAAGARAVDTLRGRWSLPVVRARTLSSHVDDDREWVVRHYARGGWAAPILGDRYLRVGLGRSFREAWTSEWARALGIPTPRVVAAAEYRSGVFRRGDLVTERIVGAVDLGTLLFGPEADADDERIAALECAGRFVVFLASKGVRHPDLNARNLLVRAPIRASCDPRETMLLIDLDRCRITGEGDASLLESLSERLLRSLRKLERIGVGAGSRFRPLAPEEWKALVRGLRRPKDSGP